MGLLKKKEVRFEPNCEFDENAGVYICEPVMEVDGKVISAKQPVEIRFDKTTGKFYPVKAKGIDEKLLSRLLDHFEKNKI